MVCSLDSGTALWSIRAVISLGSFLLAHIHGPLPVPYLLFGPVALQVKSQFLQDIPYQHSLSRHNSKHCRKISILGFYISLALMFYMPSLQSFVHCFPTFGILHTPSLYTCCFLYPSMYHL